MKGLVMTPDEMHVKAKQKGVDYLLRACESAIQRKWNGKTARVTLDEIVEITDKIKPEGVTGTDLYKSHMVYVKVIFEANGWLVTYNDDDEPVLLKQYTMDYEPERPYIRSSPYFVFSRPSSK